MGERGSAEEDRGDEEQVKGHAGEGRQGAAKSNGKKDLEFLLLLLFWLNTGILSLRQSHIFPESKAGIFSFFPQAMKLRNKLKKTDSGLKGAYAHEEDSYIEIIIP